MNKPNIALVMGGYSGEHDISIQSGCQVYEALDHQKYNVYKIVIDRQGWYCLTDNGQHIPVNRHDFTVPGVDRFNLAFIIIHGNPGENGVLQGYFDMIDLPYSTCNVLVEALTFHKFALNNYLRAFGCSVPDSIQVRRGVPHNWTAEKVKDYLGMPCFVKPTADGSSFGVTKVKSCEQLDEAMEFAFKQCDNVMIERFLDGTEVTVGCYKTKEKSVVFPVTEVVTDNEFFDYDAKYNGQVEEITPARISDELTAALQAETSRIYDILHCNGIIRIDYIITKNEDGSDHINLLEINTTPGMTVTSFIPQQVRAAGLDLKDVLTDIIENQFR